MQHQQQRNVVRRVVGIVGAVVLISSVAFVQEPKTGTLDISVSPPESYTFVDERAIGPGDHGIRLAPGKHNVIVANYGFNFLRQDVDIESGKTSTIDASLQPKGGAVSGPKGRIQLEVGLWKAGDYAVLLNGKTPYYFVGHVDEFNHDIGPWKQQLVVPPGQYNVTVTRSGRVAWTGSVPVSANERVIVDISTGKQRTVAWTAPGAQPRFEAATASAAVNVAPVSGTISANPGRINCSQPSVVQWASLETIDNEISGMSPVPPNGEATVSPRQTTTYELTGVGPGGTVKTSATLEVNPIVTAQLTVSPAELTYRRIGDKVLVQNTSATLTWSTTNADSVSISPIGTVEASGTRTVPVLPAGMTEGPIDQRITYSLQATNVCGGSNVEPASVHLAGSIEPIPAVLLNSIFFPTDYPEKRGAPNVGLMMSQQGALTAAIAGFNKYLEYDPEATLSLVGYADGRGPNKYNQSLSERRVQSVKDFLVANGIAENKIDTSSYGAGKLLEKSEVEQLQTENPNPPPTVHVKSKDASWFAYNRRVDVVLLPKNQESLRYYPNDSPDLPILWQRSKPARKLVEQHSIASDADNSNVASDEIDTSAPHL
jgi:hypothetical protein